MEHAKVDPADVRSVRQGAVCVLLNASSGKGADDERLRALEGIPGLELRRLEPGGDFAEAARQAVAEGFGTIAAAGGDGTVTGVLSGMVGSGARLLILPFGTFNFLARSLGIPENAEDALALLETGEERPLAVGEVNGIHFVNSASLGAYPAILRERERIYGLYGRSRLAAHWSAVKALLSFRSTLRLRIRADGAAGSFRTPIAFVANNAYQLRQFELAGEEALDRGRFVLFVARNAGAVELVRMALKLMAGRLKPRQDFVRLTGSEIVIETRHRTLTLAVDGEQRRLASPFRFRRIEDAVTVLVPPAAEEPAG